jgi:hypothetical protein
MRKQHFLARLSGTKVPTGDQTRHDLFYCTQVVCLSRFDESCLTEFRRMLYWGCPMKHLAFWFCLGIGSGYLAAICKPQTMVSLCVRAIKSTERVHEFWIALK